jgi:hypothetical protein
VPVASATVTVSNATIVSLIVAPSNISLAVGQTLNAAGMPIQMHAIGSYSDGSALDITNQVHFTSSNPSVAVVNNLGVVTPLAAGVTQISTTFNGVTGSFSPNIGNAVVQTIAISSLSTLAAGSTSHLTAIGTFSDSSQQDISAQVTWSEQQFKHWRGGCQWKRSWNIRWHLWLFRLIVDLLRAGRLEKTTYALNDRQGPGSGGLAVST